MSDELKVLGSTVANVAHFTDSQEKTADFQHVAKVWQQQCLTFDQGLEKTAIEQSKIQDVRGPLSDWKPVVTDNDKVGLKYLPNGNVFVPTAKAIKDMATIGFVSEFHLRDLTEDKVKPGEKEEVRFHRDRQDAELLVRTLELSIFRADRVDQSKPRLFRTWTDGTLRAVLSEQYAIVNNLWFMEVLKELIPGGLLSHWRGDADTVFGNVLIPDTIRQESDSHYGGMLSVGNSEIGLRRILSMPSVFRAICMNGCIWEQEKGVAVNQVHRGSIDHEALKVAIAKNLQAQIPLLSNGIDKVLGIRQLKIGDIPTVNAVAQFFKEYSLPKSQSAKFMNMLAIEEAILGTEVKTAFGLQSALTRLGQEYDNETWVKYDQLAGKVASLTADKWGAMMKRAATLDAQDIAKELGDVSHLL